MSGWNCLSCYVDPPDCEGSEKLPHDGHCSVCRKRVQTKRDGTVQKHKFKGNSQAVHRNGL